MTCPDRGPAAREGAPTVSVDIRPGPHRTTARVGGEIDADNQTGVRTDLGAALEASGTGVDLDLSGLDFCDSAGLHLLLDLNQLAATTDKTLVLGSVPPYLIRMFEITGLAATFTLRDHRVVDPAIAYDEES